MSQSPSIFYTSSVLYSKLAIAPLVVAGGRAQSQYYEFRLQDPVEPKPVVLLAANVPHGF
jgi:hypothetical protein